MIDLLLWPFLACVVIAAVHCYLGLHVLRRGIIFVDLALAQVAALGATLALLFGRDLHGPEAQALSLLLTVAGAALFATFRLRGEELSQEAFIGIVYAVASAAAILVLDAAKGGQEEVKNMLVGSILFVFPRDVLRLAVVSAIVGAVHVAFRRRFHEISSDADGARARGVRVAAWDFLFYLTFGLVITQSVRIAGVLLVFCFLIVPAAGASLVARSIGARLGIGWGLALVGSLAGLWLSARLDLPTGAAIVAVLGALLGAVLVVTALARRRA